MLCYICSSDKFIDNHHYDCQEGRISPETVPLCRRCHRTYHGWGIGAFSPDTTDKALEVENKRRQIHGLPLMELKDIRRSDYWYKKHNIARPSRVAAKKAAKAVLFKIPNNPPLCGEDWLRTHLEDHTSEEIGALTIEIGYDSKRLSTVSVADKRGTVKTIIKERSR